MLAAAFVSGILTAHALRQINPISVLLPFTPNPAHRVNLTLRAYDGCYQWRVQRPNAVLIRDLTKAEVEDLGDPLITAPKISQTLPQASLSSLECRSAITVTNSLPPDWQGITERSWVFAEDRDAGVKAEVYVARVNRLEIETTAKAVAVGSAETVRVKAYDEAGNVFSSLEGLDFQWTAVSDRSDSVAVSLASLNEDVYRPSSVRRAMAEDGRHSDIILIKGLESGRTRLQVKLTELGYDHVPIAHVWIDVVEPFAALPADLLAPPNAELWTSVKLLRDGVAPEDIRHFSWKDDPNFKRLSSKGALTLPADSAGNTYKLMVSDNRNANNSDWTFITADAPKRLIPYHSLLTKVLDKDCSTWTKELENNLLDLTELQFKPYSVPPGQPGSILRQISQGLDPFNTWLLEKSNEIQVLTIDLVGSKGSLHVPPNAQLSVEAIPDLQDQQLIATEKVEDIKFLRCSTNGSTCAFQVIGDVGASGKLIFTLSGDIGSLNRTLRYKIVPAMEVAGLAPQKFGEGLDKTLRASTTPVTLPVDAQAKLQILGGQGPFKVISNHPHICSATTLENSLVVSSGRLYGAALLSIRSEMYPANSFDFYCVTAPVESVYLDTSNSLNLIPLDPNNLETRVPILARAKLQKIAPMWAPDLPQDRSARELIALPAQYSVANFYSCSDLESAVALDTGSEPKAAFLDLRAAPSPFRRIAEASGSPHICSYGILQNPRSPGLVEAELQMVDPDSNKALLTPSNARIEFYTPLGAHVREASALPGPIASSAKVTSDDVDRSLSVIIGGSLIVELTGGPELGSGCVREVSTHSNPKVLIHRVGKIRDPLPNGVRSDGVPIAYRIHCLEEAPSMKVRFDLSQKCHNSPPLKISTHLNMACSWPVSLQVQPVQEGVVLLPANTSATEQHWISEVGLTDNQSLVAHLKPSKSIHAGCGQTHDFQAVAFDIYGRPLLGTQVWHWAWRWFSNSSDGAQARSKSENSVQITLPQECAGTDGALNAALIWTGDFATSLNFPEPLTKPVREKLRATSKMISSTIYKRTGWFKDKAMISTLIVHSQLPLAIYPDKELDGALLHSTDWIYVVKVSGASANAQVKLNSSVPMSIVGVFPSRASLSSLQKTVNAKKIVPLYHDTPAEAQTAARSSGNLYIYIHPIGTQKGVTQLTVNDNSLLGTHTAHLNLVTMHMSHCQLKLRDTRTGSLLSEARAELEKDVIYDVVAQAAGEKTQGLAQAVNNAFELYLNATPNRLLSVLSQNQVRAVMVGSGSLEGKIDGPFGGSAKPLAFSIDEPFAIQPPNLVLMPGGVSWRPRINGGGSVAKAWGLTPANSKYIEVTSDPTVFKTRNLLTKSTLVKVVRQSDLELGDAAEPVSKSLEGIEVIIARPERVSISADGKTWSDRLQISQHRGVRFPVSVDLWTSDNKRFTPAALLHDTTGESSQREYECRFIWTALKPEVVSIVSRTDSRRYTHLVTTLRDALTVEVFSLQLGEAKVQVKVDCSPTIPRSPLSSMRFSGSATLTLQIQDGYTEGLAVGDYLTLDGQDKSFALTAGTAPGSSCSRKPSDELVLVPDSQYELPVLARLICEISSSEATYSQLMSERIEICDTESTAIQLSHTDREVLMTGNLGADKNAVLLTPVTNDPLHRTHKLLTILLAQPTSASLEIDGETLSARPLQIPVYSRLSANEASVFVDVPLSMRLLTSSGREIQSPRDLRMDWVSSDDRVACLIRQTDGRSILRVNRSQPAHASVSIKALNSTLETTMRILVSSTPELSNVGGVELISSEKKEIPSADLHWMERYVPALVLNSAQGLSLVACAIAPVLCLFGMVPLRRNKSQPQAASAAAAVKRSNTISDQQQDGGPRRAKNVDRFFNYGAAQTFSK